MIQVISVRKLRRNTKSILLIKVLFEMTKGMEMRLQKGSLAEMYVKLPFCRINDYLL